MKKKFNSSNDPDAPRFHGWSSLLAFFTGVGSLATLIVQLGFVGQVTPTIHLITLGLAVLFTFEQVLALPDILKRSKKAQRKLWLLVVAVITLALMVVLAVAGWIDGHDHKLSLLAHATVQTIIFVTLFLRGLRHQARLTAVTLRPGWLLMGSFGSVVIVGTLLLKMPLAVTEGNTLTWLDSLFTSTSAVCVTGLVVHNTAEFFTPTGQMILLVLIQFGGLGIMTITFFMAAVLFQGMSLHDRFLLGEMIAEKRLAHVGETLRFILLFTFVTEAIGAIAIYFCLPEDRPTAERIYQSIFHSISAFCNAGFSTLPNGLADEWVKDHGTLQVVITLLAIAGGLGSLVVYDTLHYLRSRIARLFSREVRRPRLRVHTRIVWFMSALLLFGGWPLLYFTEFVIFDGNQNAGPWMTALFKSGAARTSGFNSVDMGEVSNLSIHILAFLMFVGGSPGGTAGGLRTTVVAMAAIYLWNMLRGTGQIVLFHRRLPAEVGPRALGVIVLGIGWLFVNFAILRQIQPENIPDSKLFFELVSAFGTVGLSLNLTPELTSAAKVLILINMFVGRIGLLTLIITVMPLGKKRKLAHPQEDILLV
ncbi:hypothetical protein FEM03_07020 [Phragmitibacter flavus]|uniref:ATPase n=1 Tax=Phragmitibacter flavus TaxID=2576071 RepID=A0A5R8KG38_9BACT|nr:potassium transporter TrkG [Phragmitibacter flavus]TLD71277.1 hypothetical protein FEM03_07020 [Phragmitibacter flavus]